MEPNRGVALILALLVLSFLTILGGALLTASTIDTWISDNYKTATQSLYIAEAGIDHAREVLRTSTHSPTELLNMFADQPLLASHQLLDNSGESAGYYDVWLRNDNADGMTALTDSNEVLTLVSVGQIAGTRKTLEVTIQKARFPQSESDPRLKSVRGLEGLVDGIARNAADLYDYGSVDLGPRTGRGILLVRGDLTVSGDLVWNGLVVVIGQGVMRVNSGVTTTINGGMLIARTRAADGTPLSAPADVTFSINNAAEVKAATQSFPYNPIAVKEK
jgi:Tfp pilus assembly protein PilX